MSSISELWKRLQNSSRKEREYIINSLDADTINKLRAEVNPYKKPVYKPRNQYRMLAYHFINMSEKYTQRFVMTSLIAFVYRMLNEYEPDTDLPSEKDYSFSKLFEDKARKLEFDLTVDKYNDDSIESKILLHKYRSGKSKEFLSDSEFYILSDSEYRVLKNEYKRQTGLDSRDLHPVEVDLDEEMVLKVVDETKKELGIEKTAEEYQIEQQDIIQKFLDKYFDYNPDEHVREAYKPNNDDDTREPLENTRSNDIELGKLERLILPPDDTFARWNRYIVNHYEDLRKTTDDIYAEKADFESAIAPVEMFVGSGPEECMEEYEKFKKRYADDMGTELYCVNFNNWTFTAPWSENRNKTDFYNEKTELMKRIVDQAKEDAQIGQKLMKKRITKQKDKKEPIDIPTPNIEKYGAVHVNDIKVPNIIESEVPNDPEESTSKEVEINVHNIRPVLSRDRMRIRSKLNQWKFNSPAIKPDEGCVVGGTQKKMRVQDT